MERMVPGRRRVTQRGLGAFKDCEYTPTRRRGAWPWTAAGEAPGVSWLSVSEGGSDPVVAVDGKFKTCPLSGAHKRSFRRIRGESE